MENEERIKQEMQETRSALAEKLETLEQKVVGVVGAVEEATSVVGDTVGAIKETVQDTVNAVNDEVHESVASVRDFLDVKSRVQEHPWLMVGGSVAVGYCLGVLLDKSKTSGPSATSAIGEAASQTAIGNQAPSNGHRIETATQAAAQGQLNLWAPEIAKLKGLALGVLFGTAREMIASSLPEPVGHDIKEVIDSATRKVGGEPIPSSAFASLMEPPPTRRQWESSEGHATGRRW
jgi:ElaB/YqjD/DUF883 family membrane-anchored ribosome-binding protein